MLLIPFPCFDHEFQSVDFILSRNPFSGIMAVSDIPQFITITVDDAVHASASELFKPLTIPRDRYKCGIKATFYVSIESYTKCEVVKGLRKGLHEMATHTYSHQGKPAATEIQRAKDYLVDQCGVPSNEIKGFRAPNLQWDDTTLAHLENLGFLYDSSIAPNDHSANEYGKNHTWPFTLSQESIDRFSYSGPRISAHPKLWEIPMWMMYKSDNTNDVVMDYVGGVPIIDSNFKRRYNGNRAPLGLFFHAAWFRTNGENFQKWIQDTMDKYDDVFFVTSSELIEWVRNPVPKSQYKPSCQGQKNCLPPSDLSCAFGTFNPDTCSCDCFAPYCKDATGLCMLVTGCSDPATPPNNGTNGTSSSGNSTNGSSNNGGNTNNTSGTNSTTKQGDGDSSAPTGQYCPTGFSGFRAFDACTKYYQCSNGKVVSAPQPCPAGLLFHARNSVCDWASSVSCDVDSSGGNGTQNSTNTNVTNGNATNGNTTNNNATNGNTTNGNATNGNATNGNATNGNSTNGNATNNTTTNGNTTNTTTDQGDTPAPCCSNGFSGFRAFDSCTKYYQCSNGKVMSAPQPCPPGLLFDVHGSVCNWPASVMHREPIVLLRYFLRNSMCCITRYYDRVLCHSPRSRDI